MSNHQFSSSDLFWGLLMDKAYPIFKEVVNLNENYLLFINSIESWDSHAIAQASLYYGGIDEQLKYLKGPPKWGLDYWSLLKHTKLSVAESIESKRYLGKHFPSPREIAGASYIGNLSNYFSEYLVTTVPINESQEYEYHILRYYFDIERDHFLSIPIEWNSRIVTVIQVIFSHKDRAQFEQKNKLETLLALLNEEHALLVRECS